MKVKLISTTQNLLDVLFTGARTCYNAGSPIDMFEEVGNIPPDKKLKLINGCIKSSHLSVLEHSQFTFAIEGVSRSLLAQISRHRVAVSLSVQSQRYVEIKENQDYLADLYTDLDTEDYINSELCHILDKYFVDAHKFKNLNGYYFALDNYLEAIKMGDKPEEARRFLPNATKTNMVITLNLRSLIHLCNERLCTRAQLEIRQLVQLMVKEVLKENEWLKPYLQPKCESLGYCPEHKGCGRKPSYNQLVDKE